MKALIIANGQIEPNLEVPNAELVIAADGGAEHALRQGISPQVVIGDLDSLPEETRQKLAAAGCEFIVHPAAKDATDLELAVDEAQRRGAKEVVVLGTFGARPDQTLANFLFPTKPNLAGVTIEYQGRGWRAVLVHNSLELSGQPGDIVSILLLSEQVSGVSTEGLLFPLHDSVLLRGSTRGVSNEMTGKKVRIKVKDGILWVIHIAPEKFREGGQER